MLQGVLFRFLGLFIGFVCLSVLLASPQLAIAQALVTTQALAELVYQPRRAAPAQVIALNDSRISAEISAVVTRLLVDVGSSVAQGAVLAELDCSDYELQARELAARRQGTQARMQFSEGQLKRARSLQKQRTVSEELVEQRQSERDTLQAELAMLAAELARIDRSRARCQIIAPFAGVVVERLIDNGEYVTPGTPLFRLLADTTTEVTAQIPIQHLPSLQQSEQMWLQTPIDEYALQLRTVLPLVDSTAQTRTVRLQFISHVAPAGSAGRLRWQLRSHIPAQWLVQRDNQLGVFLAINGRATFQALPGAQEGRPAAIHLRGDPPVNSELATLAPTSLIITEGGQGLKDGDLITRQP